MKPLFFENSAELRRWLKQNHDKATELWIGFYKKASGKPSVTYKEALDEALCFGWIDGVRKSIDAESYQQRFSPRRAKSIWSLINIKRAEELKELGRMKPAGLKAFEARDPKRSGVYSFENAQRKLDKGYEKIFRANKAAWKFYESQPPYFKKVTTHWIMSGKKEETRLRRLQRLIDTSEQGIRMDLLTGKAKSPQRH